MITKTNIADEFSTFTEAWTPKIGGDINDVQVKLAKFDGAFIWHSHEREDELFLVVEGRLRIELRDQPDILLEGGEYAIIPRGVAHRPVAETPCNVILLEPKSTVNTGSEQSGRTIRLLSRIPSCRSA